MGGSRSTNKLFVEGSDDLFVILHVVQKLRPALPREPKAWAGGFEAVDSRSDERALKSFGDALLSASGSYGLVLDADDQPRKNLHARWDAVRKVLGGAGVVTPVTPPQGGWLGQVGPGPTRGGSGPRLGVWIMPDNLKEGALEAFIEPFVPAGDTSWGFADQVIDAAKTSHGAPFPESQRRKARMHTWLAWRSEPGRPYGRAVACGDLTPEADPVARSFVDWFVALFGL